ncbi:MAG: pyridoxamine 5'-phosphate oxidase family protein [Chitinophagaceae bacterium]
MNDPITRFIGEQTCASVCCVDEKGEPYCFSCYYSFDSKTGLLYYKSSSMSRHSAILDFHPVVAGTILPDRLNQLKVRGIQFEGVMLPSGHPLTKAAARDYYMKHPLAITVPGEIRIIQINHIKFTDSTAGFGKKQTWSRREEPEMLFFDEGSEGSA